MFNAEVHSFRNDECLVLSLDSPFAEAPDCYQIELAQDRFTLQAIEQVSDGTPILAVAVSQPYYAIATLTRKGIKCAWSI